MKDLLVVFGEGGHAEQMKRLLKNLEVTPNRCISIVDKEGISLGLVSEENVMKPLRKKYGKSYISILSSSIFLLIKSIKIFVRYDIQTVISTGPGLCIIPALLFRIMGKQIIHIETWSRFESRSPTGYLMYYLAQNFYVQNKSLLMLYKSAKYSGRL